MGRALEVVDDSLWALIEPHLPAPPPRKGPGGRPRCDDRRCLNLMIYVLRTGVPWGWLPSFAGWPSGTTAWRRLKTWQEAGVWERVQRLLLARLRQADKLDLSRAAVDSSIVRAIGAGEKEGAK